MKQGSRKLSATDAELLSSVYDMMGTLDTLEFQLKLAQQDLRGIAGALVRRERVRLGITGLDIEEATGIKVPNLTRLELNTEPKHNATGTFEKILRVLRSA